MLSVSLIGFAIGQAKADFTGETAHWIQSSALLPDGKLIVFTHRDQTFLADNDCGLAFSILLADAYSHSVVWVPDSKLLACASDVNGDDDVYVVTLQTVDVKTANQIISSSINGGSTSRSPYSSRAMRIQLLLLLLNRLGQM